MKLIKPKNLLPFTISALLCTAVAAPFSLYADSFTLSGQINRMVANIDNGSDSELQFLDNNGSGTRLRLKGEMDQGNGMKTGFYWETQYQSNKSSTVDASTIADTGDATSSRHRDIWIKGDFGKVSLGQGNGAANGITEIEYTGTTYLTGYASANDIWGGVTFGGTSIKVGDVVDGYDALSRNDRLRYDSPKLGPVTLSIDTGTGGKTELAVRFDTAFGGGKIKGGVGTWDQNDAGSKKGTAGSLAFMHDSGFNAGIHFASVDATTAGASDPGNTMITLGYQTGPHSLSVRLGTTDDKVDGVSADSAGLGYVNRSMKGVEMYAGLQSFSVDVSSADDITILFGGARVKF